MSYHNPPKFSAPSHGDPIATVAGSTVANYFRSKESSDQSIWGPIAAAAENACDNMLDAKDKYLKEAPEQLWDQTSFYTGNTRGALKLVGQYPRTEIEFDIEEWFKPKTLTNLVPKTVHAEWQTKSGKKSKTYVYPAGSQKVKITGEDYAPRIPLPAHGGGDVYMLKEVFDELRDAEWERIIKSKGIA